MALQRFLTIVKQGKRDQNTQTLSFLIGVDDHGSTHANMDNQERRDCV